MDLKIEKIKHSSDLKGLLHRLNLKFHKGVLISEGMRFQFGPLHKQDQRYSDHKACWVKKKISKVSQIKKECNMYCP